MDLNRLRLPQPAAGFGEHTQASSTSSMTAQNLQQSSMPVVAQQHMVQAGSGVPPGAAGNVGVPPNVPGYLSSSQSAKMDIDDNGSFRLAPAGTVGPIAVGSGTQQLQAATAISANVTASTDQQTQIQFSGLTTPADQSVLPTTVSQNPSTITQDVVKQQAFIQQQVHEQNLNMPQTAQFAVCAANTSGQGLPQNIPAGQVLQHGADFQSSDPKQVAQVVTPHLQAHTGSFSLSDVSAEEQRRIRAEVEADIFKQLTAQQLQNLQAEAQATILKQLSPEQIKEIHIQAEAVIFEQMKQEKMKELQIQQQLIATQVASAHPAVANPQQQILPSVSLSPDQQSILTYQDLSKITMEKIDGRKKEFYVHDKHGAEVYNYCEQFNVSGSSVHSGSLILGATDVQRFPAHTLRHVEDAQLQQFNKSQHSDTSSSLASGVPSFHSAGSAGDQSAIASSGSISDAYSALRAQHIAEETQVEMAHLDSIQADIDMRKAELKLKMQKVRSYQNLRQSEGK